MKEHFEHSKFEVNNGAYAYSSLPFILSSCESLHRSFISGV